MGFLFRLCFWLAVTLAIMPPDERPGDVVAGAPESATLEQRFAATVQTAWGLLSQISTACEQNPELCAATSALAQTAAETGQSLADSVSIPSAQAAPARPPAPARIDRPLAEPNHDGRVGRGETPEG
jgi:hypothetical protein